MFRRGFGRNIGKMPPVANILSLVLVTLGISYVAFVVFTETIISRELLASDKITEPRKLIEMQSALSRNLHEKSDYMLSAAVALQYNDHISAVDWRHHGSGVEFYRGKLYYVGQIGKLIREKHPQKSPHWNKISKFFFARLSRNVSNGKLQFKSMQMKFDPFNEVKATLLSKKKFADPPEFRSNADCEFQFDGSDGGHGYQDPKLITLNDSLYLIFSSRAQVRNRTFCRPGSTRSLYLCKVTFHYHDSDSTREIARCSNPTMITALVRGKRKSKTTWIPFVHRDRLHISAGFYPQRVIFDCFNLLADGAGACTEVYRSEASGGPMNLGQFSVDDSHLVGGSTAVLASFEGMENGCYMGVAHYSFPAGNNRKDCVNLLYKMEGAHPFRLSSFERLTLSNSTSKIFRELSQKGPSFYKKLYPAHLNCAAISDAVIIPRSFFREAELCPELFAGERLVVSYGVSEAETRIHEMDLKTI